MYALLRGDLVMTKGKASSQAGHAFLDSFLLSANQRAYLDQGGTKIVLAVPDERTLRDLHSRAQAAGLPCALVVESTHIHPPDFDGSPVVTAVGLGPLRRSEARKITKGLKLM